MLEWWRASASQVTASDCSASCVQFFQALQWRARECVDRVELRRDLEPLTRDGIIVETEMQQ